MGWLRDFMAQAEIRSFGELARQALAHAEWPPDTKAQQRSLEAILGRLDRQEDLDWLTDRLGVQQVLSTILGISVAELRTTLVGTAGPKPTINRLRFDDLRAARSLELSQEPLPPTIPELLESPASWGRHCWLGGSGSGFSLVAHWLSARGLAQTRSVETLEELRQLPITGAPLYVELASELVTAFQAEWKGCQPLCLAIQTEQRQPAAERDLDGFVKLSSAPIQEQLEQVVDWVLYRISERSVALRTRLLDWLRSGPMQWGVIESLGDAFGFVGAYLDAGVDVNRGETKRGCLNHWLAQHTDGLARERHRDSASLRQLLPELLIDMAQAALTDESRSLVAARTIDEWLNLVPEQHRRGPDIDWLTTRLVSDNLPIRQSDLERAALRLPPGAHRIIVALRELQLLRPISTARFALRPHFIARLSHSLAVDSLVESSPYIWGEALLREHARLALMPKLQALAHRQPENLAEDVLEQVDLESPALVCAFETSFVLLGLSVLTGEDIGETTALSLLKEQSALLIEGVHAWPTSRTIPCNVSLCDSPGTFFLAAWALSEHLPSSARGLHAALDPWHMHLPDDHWAQVLTLVEASIGAALPQPPPWLLGAVRLLDRIRQFVGAQVGLEPHPIFLAGILLDAVELGVLEWGAVEELHRLPYGFALLSLAVGTRKIAPERLASQLMDALWAAWRSADRPTSGSAILLDLPAELTRCASPETLARWLLVEGATLPDATLESLPSAVWQAWLNEPRAVGVHDEPLWPWRHAPPRIVAEAVEGCAPVREEIQ
ncbi:MAG TPA: hypothetical protein VIV60_00835, partial [Polyangiaceae bacterium]